MKKISLLLSLLFLVTLAGCEISQVRIIAQEQLSPILDELEASHEDTITYEAIEYSGIYAGVYDIDDSEDYVEEHLKIYIIYTVDNKTYYAIGSHFSTYDPEETAEPHEHDIDVTRYETESDFDAAVDAAESSLDDIEDSLNLIEVEMESAEVNIIRTRNQFDIDEIDDYHFE